MKKKLLIIIFFFNFNHSYSEEKLAYIDINYILNNSTVGQSITNHLQNIKENKKKEFLKIEDQLKNKEKDIITKKNIIEKNEFDEKISILKNEINNSISMVLPKKKIIIAKKKLDITNEIIILLNNQLKKIDF